MPIWAHERCHAIWNKTAAVFMKKCTSMQHADSEIFHKIWFTVLQNSTFRCVLGFGNQEHKKRAAKVEENEEVILAKKVVGLQFTIRTLVSNSDFKVSVVSSIKFFRSSVSFSFTSLNICLSLSAAWTCVQKHSISRRRTTTKVKL